MTTCATQCSVPRSCQQKSGANFNDSCGGNSNVQALKMYIVTICDHSAESAGTLLKHDLNRFIPSSSCMISMSPTSKYGPNLGFREGAGSALKNVASSHVKKPRLLDLHSQFSMARPSALEAFLSFNFQISQELKVVTVQITECKVRVPSVAR